MPSESFVQPVSRRLFLQGVASTGVVAATRFPLLAQNIATSNSAVVQTLTSGWEFLKDSLAGPWEAWTDQSNPWSKITVPHCFNAMDACDPEIPYYQGAGWYRTRLKIENPFTQGRTLLHFEGAGQESKVYVGEDLAEEHVGGYDEFVVDITSLAAKHANDKDGVPLAVMCSNVHSLDRIPSQMSDFTLYGGLYRKVHLAYMPEVSLSHVRIDAVSEPNGKDYRITCIPYGYSDKPITDATVTIEIFTPEGKSIYTSQPISLAKGKETESGPTFFLKNAALWSPDSPSLYLCRATLHCGNAIQIQEERFGCRSFHFEEHGAFYLNGEKCFLRGTHRHEDHAGYGAATPDEIIRKELQLIKDMGANFIRLGHYQQSKLILDTCDELGLLVWEEVPWCRAGAGTGKMQAMVLEKLATMIQQHHNHPSIIFWGLGNEDDWPGEYPSINKEEIRALMKNAHDLAHSLDPTRLTSYRRCDFARDIPDVYSPSIWAGWYGGAYTDYQKSLETQRARVKHMLHIEWGADSHAGRHSEKVPLVEIPKGETTAETGMAFKMTGGSPRMSKDGDWSETYACDLFDWHLKVQETLPWFAGSAQWIFKDFTTPLRPENPVPRINQKGVVARDLTLKESYYVFQSYWAKKPMLHIYGHTWPVRWGSPEEEKTVKVYSNCPEVELFVNGKSMGKKKRDSQNFPAAGLRWEVPFLAGGNTIRAIGHHEAGVVEDTIQFQYQTELWGKPASLRLQLRALEFSGKDGNAIIDATLHDAHGNLCLDAANEVHFSIAGDAQLIENMGTPWGSRTVQLANGRAMAQLTIQHGQKCVLAVASDDIPGASIYVG